MKDLPAHQLDPKVKTVWRINDAIWLTVVFLCCFVPFAIAAMVDPATWMFVVLVAVAVAYAACLIVWLIVLPPIRFMRWRYELSSDYLDIAKGIVWRKRFVIWPRRTCDDGLSPTAPTSAAPASARCAPTPACCAAA